MIKPEFILPPELPLNLIGISGKAGTGKDTLANMLVDCSTGGADTFIVPLAEPLKECLAKLMGLPLDHFNDREIKDSVNDYWGVSPRKIAQHFGTEVIRNGLFAVLSDAFADSNFWVRRLHGYITNQLVYEYEYGVLADVVCPHDVIIIPDVRFQNEADYILANGGVIISLSRDTAPEIQTGIPNHSSEALDLTIPTERNYKYPNNGALEDLQKFAEFITTDLANR